MRRTVDPPLVAHETTRKAREDCTAAVIAARIAWSLRYTVVSPVAAAQLCASTDRPPRTRSTRPSTSPTPRSTTSRRATRRGEAAIAILGASDDVGACSLTEGTVAG